MAYPAKLQLWDLLVELYLDVQILAKDLHDFQEAVRVIANYLSAH